MKTVILYIVVFVGVFLAVFISGIKKYYSYEWVYSKNTNFTQRNVTVFYDNAILDWFRNHNKKKGPWDAIYINRYSDNERPGKITDVINEILDRYKHINIGVIKVYLSDDSWLGVFDISYEFSVYSTVDDIENMVELEYFGNYDVDGKFISAGKVKADVKSDIFNE